MERVSKFEKVSYEQFENDVIKLFGNRWEQAEIRKIYNRIQLPVRATTGSAGYDFKSPFDMIAIDKTSPVTIPTGIRVKIKDGWALKVYPRSGLGFKWGMNLVNTVGIIDSDYYNSNNEGHIMIKASHSIGEDVMAIEEGQGFAQGIFEKYGITEDDIVDGLRNGGFGSTDK